MFNFLKKNVKKTAVCVFATAYLSSASAQELSVSKLIAKSLDTEILKLFELDKAERIEFSKAIAWKVAEDEFYFLPISYKMNQGCRFVFVDAGKRKLLSDGAFNFERCTFIKSPELIDINHDGKTDFRVWIKLPHHVGTSVMVLHNLDFIYDEKKKMFCEVSSGTPCNLTSQP